MSQCNIKDRDHPMAKNRFQDTINNAFMQNVQNTVLRVVLCQGER